MPKANWLPFSVEWRGVHVTNKVVMVPELWRREGAAGSDVEAAGAKEEEAGPPYASAGVHHLVPAQGGQHGKTHTLS